MLKLITLIMILAGAQAATLTPTGPATAQAGSSIAIAITALGEPVSGTGAAGLQWSLILPPGYTATVAPGPAATAASKDRLTCAANNAAPCLLVGTNATVIGNGVIATHTVTIPAGASGPVMFTLAGLVGATPAGTAAALTAGAPYVVNVTGAPADPRDINGDGRVDDADIALMAVEVLAANANPAACVHDIDHDGSCTVRDVQLVINKRIGTQP